MTTDTKEFKEKLEAAHEFPCNYTFKLFGPNDDVFNGAADDIVKRHLPGVKAQSSSRVSSKSNHQCRTLILPVISAQQIIDMYADFHKIDRLKMLL